MFTFSSLVLGPALTSSGDDTKTPATRAVPGAPPPGVSESEHQSHHGG